MFVDLHYEVAQTYAEHKTVMAAAVTKIMCKLLTIKQFYCRQRCTKVGLLFYDYLSYYTVYRRLGTILYHIVVC